MCRPADPRAPGARPGLRPWGNGRSVSWATWRCGAVVNLVSSETNNKTVPGRHSGITSQAQGHRKASLQLTIGDRPSVMPECRPGTVLSGLLEDGHHAHAARSAH